MCVYPLPRTAVVISALVFSLQALPLSSELLIKTPNLACGSLLLSFPFTAYFSFYLFPSALNTHQRQRWEFLSSLFHTVRLELFRFIFATRTNYCNKANKFPCWTSGVIISHHFSACLSLHSALAYVYMIEGPVCLEPKEINRSSALAPQRCLWSQSTTNSVFKPASVFD